jgi:hypothetical protein
MCLNQPRLEVLTFGLETNGKGTYVLRRGDTNPKGFKKLPGFELRLGHRYGCK